MATLKHEHSINEEEIYFNFINSIKSEVTKKTYYTEKSTGILKDRDGVRVEWNRSTGKLEAIK
jgi:hypothetical protein